MQDIAVFAQTTYRNEFKKFGIKTDDRRRHMYLVGKTGMGKSTILENMIVDDIRAGHGVAVVDPHGDLAEKIIEYIPSNRIQDVIYFNPSDINFPIAFNVVEQVEPHLRHLVASGLIGVFQKLWADSWGPRLEYILRNAILAILDFPGSTLMGVVRMLSDKNYRKRVVSNIQDPVVKAFWEKEFSGYADKFASEAVSPIQNKVGQFLSSSLMRNIIGQVKSSIDIRDIMDNGKILIMNLSKGRIGEDNSALLGAMMITKIQLAAMSRVDVPEKERRDFYLYIDEFQNFSTDSFANILSEARKYRLNLILAHQYIEQLSEKVKPAVFGNVGTMVVFRVGAADAEELVKEFTPTFVEEDLVNLPKYEMYLKLMIDGIASSPFSAKGLPPLRADESTFNTQKVIDYSREKYASERTVVEEKIMRWHEVSDDDLAPEPAARKNLAGGPNAPIRQASYTPTNQNPFTTQAAPVVQKLAATSPLKTEPMTQTTTTFTQKTTTIPQSQINSQLPTNSASQMNSQAQINNQPTSRPQAQMASRAGLTPLTQMPVGQDLRPAQVSGVPQANLRSANSNLNLNPNPNATVNRPRIISSAAYEAVCASCGRDTTTNFIPDGVRPVYCKDCLSKKKEEKRVELEKRHLAKEIERNHLEEETVLVETAPAMSLADLGKARPVDFKGREIKNERPRINQLGQGNQINQANHSRPVEHDLAEGEDMMVSNNQF